MIEFEEWMADAECQTATDPDIFFPEGEYVRTMARAAKTYCRVCLVSEECLKYALDNNIGHGIFAGLGPKERRALQLRRA